MPPRNDSTHDLLRTSAHPCRRLVKNRSVVAVGSSPATTVSTTRGRSGTRSTTDTTNVAASNSSAVPGPPANAISRPASNGPAIAPTE